MAWDRNDYIAAGFILMLIFISVVVAAMLLGGMPRVDEVFKFTGEPEKTAFIRTSLRLLVLE
jgi:hypothetical protein